MTYNTTDNRAIEEEDTEAATRYRTAGYNGAPMPSSSSSRPHYYNYSAVSPSPQQQYYQGRFPQSSYYYAGGRPQQQPTDPAADADLNSLFCGTLVCLLLFLLLVVAMSPFLYPSGYGTEGWASSHGYRSAYFHDTPWAY